MRKIFLFSGTSEGRIISEALSKASVYHTVFVATEYGRMVMEPSGYVTIREGRLSSADMKVLFEEESPDIVIDATHPYATEVTENIAKACEHTGAERYRIGDRIGDVPFATRSIPLSHVDDTETAVEKLKSVSGNILLTTGVKTLSQYMSDNELKDRIFVRILPSMESLSIALETGIKPGHIIAQEGPFTVESNEALISQYDIKVLVTKNSGNRGGFEEKIKACENKSVEIIIIDPKPEKEGISVEEVISKLTGKKYKEKRVVITGIGPGRVDMLTAAAQKAIKNADLLIGAKRMVELGKIINSNAQSVCEYEALKILDVVEKNSASFPVILMSGDTGFHSGAGKSKDILERAGYEVEVLPGISSVSYFASVIGWEYSDCKLLSLHGEEHSLDSEIVGCTKFYAILSGPEDINKVTSLLDNRWEVAVGYNLGYEDESIEIAEADKISLYINKGLYIVAARIKDKK